MLKDMDLEKQGLMVYEGFNANFGTFATAIDIWIDPVQYWRDRPLLLKRITPALNEIISPDIATELPENVNYYLEELEKAGLASEEYYKKIGTIIQDLEKYSEINEGENLDIEYPDAEENTITVNVLDEDGNVIDSVVSDINAREPNITPQGEKPVTILTELPPDYTDDDSPTEPDEVTITSLPESYIKEKLWIADEYNRQFMEDAYQAAKDYQQEIDSISNNIKDPEAVTNEDVENFLEDYMLEDIEIWYGIPLINFSSRDVPLKDSVILQIDTKHDWTLHLTNVFSSDFQSSELRITDVQIPPDKRFVAGVYVYSNSVTIYLKIDGDPTIYRESAQLASPLELTLASYGSDSHGIKRICGKIYDYFFWQTPTEYIPGPGDALPLGPTDEGSNVFDGAGPRIRGNYIYPRKNWREPAYNGGDWLDLNENFKFVYNGYLDNFFCKDNIKYTDFTIFWYQYQLGYPTGIRTLVADSINSNYIRYDYDTFELMIDFNNVHYRERITLPEYLWFQVAVRYKMDTNELVFSFIDFWGDIYEEVLINIGPDLNFELISLWGRYDKETKYYTEIGRGVFGLVIISDRFYSKDQLFEYYADHKKFLSQFNPRYMELPA
jgi:hypothetical protein